MRNVLEMALKLLFLPKNCKNHLAAGGLPSTWRAWVASFVQRGTYIRQFLCNEHLLLVKASSLLAKPWLRFWSHSLMQRDVSSDSAGRIQNELINAAGLIHLFFQRWIQNCSFKISVFVCKSSVYFSAPLHFRLGPPHFVCFGDGIAGSMWLSRSYSIYRNQGLRI